MSIPPPESPRLAPLLCVIAPMKWPATLRSAAGGIGAVTTGSSGLPETFAADMSALASIRPISDGLIGVASMRTTTSSGLGSEVVTRASDSSRMPSVLTVERSCRPDRFLGHAFSSGGTTRCGLMSPNVILKASLERPQVEYSHVHVPVKSH